jgi:hypothetical protein
MVINRELSSRLTSSESDLQEIRWRFMGITGKSLK